MLVFLVKPLSRNSPTTTFLRPRLFSTLSSQTAEFFRTALGLSPASSHAAARSLGLRPKPTAKTLSTVALLRRHGFTSPDLAAMFVRNPKLISADPDKTIAPKLDFFVANGVSGQTLVRMIAKTPFILTRGSNTIAKQASAYLAILRDFAAGDEEVESSVLRRGGWAISNSSENMSRNIETLRLRGLPEKTLAKMFVNRTRLLAKDPVQFDALIAEAEKMGFDTTSSLFVYSFPGLSLKMRDKASWEAKVAVFKRFGLSDQRVHELILKQPQLMVGRVERIEKNMEFLSRELDWGPAEIFDNPTVILFSLVKRLAPRSAVLRELVSKDAVPKKHFGYALRLTEDKFLKYMARHLSKCPRLMDLYLSKIPVSGQKIKMLPKG